MIGLANKLAKSPPSIPSAKLLPNTAPPGSSPAATARPPAKPKEAVNVFSRVGPISAVKFESLLLTSSISLEVTSVLALKASSPFAASSLACFKLLSALNASCCKPASIEPIIAAPAPPITPPIAAPTGPNTKPAAAPAAAPFNPSPIPPRI